MSGPPRHALLAAVDAIPMRPETREALQALALDDLIVSRRPGWFQAFVRRAWSVIDAKPLMWNWHFTLICLELELVAAGITRELLVEQPPGTGKSIVLSGMFPAALWLHEPGYQILSITNTDDNASRDSKRQRDIVLSPWYRSLVDRIAAERGIGMVEVFGHAGQRTRRPWELAADQSEKRNFQNEAGGLRQAVTVGGTIIGRRARGLIVDDPYKAQDLTEGSPASIAEAAASVVAAYDGNWLTRIDPVDGWRITDMQGLCDGDLADVLRRRGVRRVSLPTEAILDETITVTRPGQPPREERLMHPRDPRKTEGEILFPARFPADAIAAFKATPDGIAVWDPQYQQRRRPLGGKLFPRSWYSLPPPEVGVRRYTAPPAIFARGLQHIGISVDCSLKDTAKSDRVAIHAWGWRDDSTARYFLDRVADQMDVFGTITAIVNMHARWTAAVRGKARVEFVLVEDKALGPAVLTILRGKNGVPGLVAYNPRDPKYVRAQATSWAVQAGEIWYPMPEHAPWLHEVVEQHATFTGAAGGVDDDVDAESQILIFLRDEADNKPRPPTDWREHLKKTVGFLGG